MSVETAPAATTPAAPPPVAGAPAGGTTQTTTTSPAPAAGASGAPTNAPQGALGAQAPVVPDANANKTDDKPKDGSPADEGELSVKLPDGVTEDALLMSEFKPLAKELGLKSDAAQKLVDLHAKALTSLQKQGADAFNTQHTKWVETMKADKEISAVSYEKGLEVAQRAIAKFGTPELRELLKSPVIGSQPELVRFMVRVGKALAEDSVQHPNSGAPNGELSHEEQLRIKYPTHYKNSQE